MHVTKDIPEAIRAAETLYPEVYTEPLGSILKARQNVSERMSVALADGRPPQAQVLHSTHREKSFDIGDSIDLSECLRRDDNKGYPFAQT